MSCYFILAKGTKTLPYANNFPWPYEVSICFDAVDRPVVFAEGVGHGAAGGVFTAQEALQPQWREHFALAKGEWLLPFIKQLAAGHLLNAPELLALAASKLGEAPQSYECAD
jgi:hypothetical protein